MYPVIFVSLGPGDPELITLKGWKALQEADCIFCPETQSKSSGNPRSVSRAAAILRQLDIEEKRICRFPLPMSRQRAEAQAAYDNAFAEIAALHRNERKVCVAVEGDAGFYASIHYIYERLQKNDIEVEHIAGVPAFIAAGAWAGIHMASGDETLTVLPGTATAGEVMDCIDRQGVVVIMKLSKCAQAIRELLQLRPDYSYHYFENVSTDNDVYLTATDEIDARTFPYFSMLVVRKPGEPR